MEDAFASMQRTIQVLRVIKHSADGVQFEIKGPSFAYNQILRIMGLFSEVSILEKSSDVISQCFDKSQQKVILKAPAEGLILTEQLFKKD